MAHVLAVATVTTPQHTEQAGEEEEGAGEEAVRGTRVSSRNRSNVATVTFLHKNHERPSEKESK